MTSDLCVQRGTEGDCPDKNILHPFAESTFDQALRNPIHTLAIPVDNYLEEFEREKQQKDSKTFLILYVL